MFERTRSLIGKLTGASGEPPQNDRRAWDRFRSDRVTAVLADDDGAPLMSARVRDVSRGGARLLVDQPLDAGDTIRIELPPHNGDPHAAVLACVVHVASAGEGQWSIGCSFATELNDGDLAALGAKRVRTADSDKRSWERMPVNVQASYRVSGGHDEPRSAAIHNLSPSGVALRLPVRLEPGRLVSLELRTEAEAAPVSILACVVYMSETGPGEWLAGCNFIRELDDDELQKLI